MALIITKLEMRFQLRSILHYGMFYGSKRKNKCFLKCKLPFHISTWQEPQVSYFHFSGLGGNPYKVGIKESIICKEAGNEQGGWTVKRF